MTFPVIALLKKDQVEALQHPLEESCIITGPPGSGKTVVAIHRANRAHDAERKSVLIMYNNVLQSYTQHQSDTLGLSGEQTTFIRWFRNFHREHCNGALPPLLSPSNKFVYDWDTILENPKFFEIEGDAGIDAIIDEGQDLPNEFYAFVEMIGSSVTIFADGNQSITKQNSTVEEIQNWSRIEKLFTLTKNFRNTQQIAELAGSIASRLNSYLRNVPGAGLVSDLNENRQGERPLLMPDMDFEDTVEFILDSEERNPGWDIGVLTYSNRLQDKLMEAISEGKTERGGNLADRPAQYYRWDMPIDDPSALDWEEKSIKLVNYQSAKGVEFDQVIIPELQTLPGPQANPNEPTTQMLFYVLITRAKEELALCYSGSGAPAIMELFPDEYLQIDL